MEDLYREIRALRQEIERLRAKDAPMGAPTSWTPTVTQGVAVTYSSVSGSYHPLGRLAFVQMTFVCSSAGTATNPIVIGGWPASLTTLHNPIGLAWVLDVSTTWYNGIVQYVGANDWRIAINNNNNYLGAAPALTLASGDVIYLNCLYQWLA